MRLVCPNCEAKYEVPDDAIPDTGRDVQCANCGHAWFQMRNLRPATMAPAAAPAPVAEAPVPAAATEPEPAPVEAPAAEVAAPAPDPVAETTAPDMVEVKSDPVVDALPADLPAAPEEPKAAVPVEATAEPAPEVVAEPAAEATAEPVAETDTVAVTPAAASGPSMTEEDVEAALEAAVAQAVPEPAAKTAPEASPVASSDAAGEDPDLMPEPEATLEAERSTYAVDDSVLAILREEAEREANARRAEARALETQTELAIDAAGAASADADNRPAPRRDLLPDVEEINSTLRPSEVEEQDFIVPSAPVPSVRSQSSFRSGFVTVIALALLATGAYLAAPQIGGAVPFLERPLTAFVGQIDSLRLSLDGLMRTATVAINGD